MKLSHALKAACVALSLSSASAAATTSVSVNDATEKAKPGTTDDLQISFTSAAAHTGTTHYFEVTLPDSFDNAFTATVPATGELVMTCELSGGSDQAITIGTDYNGAYDSSTRKLKLTYAANKLCIAGAVKLTLKKATLRAAKVTANTVKVTNSAESAETTTPVTGPSSDVALVTALTGTAPSAVTIDESAKTVELSYKPGADISSGKMTVVLYDYTAGSSAACKIGSTAITTLSKGTEGKWTWLEATLSTTDKLLTASANTITCTEITPKTSRTSAYAGGVQLWIDDAKASFLATPATAAPTAAPTNTTSSPTKPPTAKDESSSSKAVASTFVIAATAFAATSF